MNNARISSLAFLLLAFGAFEASAETETIDLKALAKKARPAVMLLVVSDATGKGAERRGQPRDNLVRFRDPQGEASGSERSQIATGAGLLVSSDGKPKRRGDAAVS